MKYNGLQSTMSLGLFALLLSLYCPEVGAFGKTQDELVFKEPTVDLGGGRYTYPSSFKEDLVKDYRNSDAHKQDFIDAFLNWFNLKEDKNANKLVRPTSGVNAAPRKKRFGRIANLHAIGLGKIHTAREMHIALPRAGQSNMYTYQPTRADMMRNTAREVLLRTNPEGTMLFVYTRLKGENEWHEHGPVPLPAGYDQEKITVQFNPDDTFTLIADDDQQVTIDFKIAH